MKIHQVFYIWAANTLTQITRLGLLDQDYCCAQAAQHPHMLIEICILFTLEERKGWIAPWLIPSTSTAEAVVLQVFPVLL